MTASRHFVDYLLSISFRFRKKRYVIMACKIVPVPFTCQKSWKYPISIDIVTRFCPYKWGTMYNLYVRFVHTKRNGAEMKP
jgi:hypothetical protein